MVDLNQNFRKFLLGYKDKATVKKLPENYEGWQKMAFCCSGGHLPPHAIPWLRACFVEKAKVQSSKLQHCYRKSEMSDDFG